MLRGDSRVNPPITWCAEGAVVVQSVSVTDFTIREARPEDFEAIINLWFSIERHTALPDRPELLQRFHEFSPDLFLVAESEGRIVGTVIGGWDGWRANIARLATDASVRRTGIAKALVDEIELRLWKRGARRIYALVDRRSPPAIPFWEAAGYTANENIIQYSRNLPEEGPGS
jgi:ribosomal protein S18 acetylase RimI-like enzyme